MATIAVITHCLLRYKAAHTHSYLVFVMICSLVRAQEVIHTIRIKPPAILSGYIR